MPRTFCLAMIVRDAEATITDCLASVRPLIDTWVIIDTGSADETRQLITDAMAGLDGELLERPWVNFAHNRTELMQAARDKADWLILLDADMVVHLEEEIPELTDDVYECPIRDGGRQAYTLPIVVRGSRDWCYRGVAHSYLAMADDGSWSPALLPTLWIEDRSSTTPAKLQRDLDVLQLEHARNPLDARTCFYLAQTYADLGQIPEAIAAYRTRAALDGWPEETYVARQRLGALLVEHESFSAGARELLEAWEMRPGRAEALRLLSNAADSVADKIPLPADRLFVRPGDYRPQAQPLPPFPELKPRRRRRITRPLTYDDVTAILVTRGNVDLEPILETLPYSDVVIWNNADREQDYKVLGRYAAIPEARNPVIYWQDDDVLFTEHDQLLAAYQPRRIISNMDEPWVQAAGYGGLVAMVGAGSLCDSDLPRKTFARYLAAYPYDDDLLLEADFAFGVLTPHVRVDLGYYAFAYADAPDRLYHQPGQHTRKWEMIERSRQLRDRRAAAL